MWHKSIFIIISIKYTQPKYHAADILHLLFMNFKHSVNDWDFSTFNFKHDNLSNSYWFFDVIGQKK